MAQIGITLPGFTAQFDKAIDQEIKSVISKGIKKVTGNIKRRVQVTARTLLTQSPEYQSFFGGALQAELGVPDPTVIDAVINQWIEGITVRYVTTGGKFGSVSLGMIESDYSDVLTMSEATYFYTGRNGSGSIDWLRWLLLEGNNAIVRDYDFTRSITRGSRTGLGVMVNRKGGVWRVPTEFAGIQTDNFVLRALQEIDKEIDIVVRQEITKGLK